VSHRPLEDVYPVIFVDALVLKILEGGTVQRRACYLALGITVEGDRDVLGLWFQETEGAKFWMQVLTESWRSRCSFVSGAHHVQDTRHSAARHRHARTRSRDRHRRDALAGEPRCEPIARECGRTRTGTDGVRNGLRQSAGLLDDVCLPTRADRLALKR
jgi:Transposase, Mutator family